MIVLTLLSRLFSPAIAHAQLSAVIQNTGPGLALAFGVGSAPGIADAVIIGVWSIIWIIGIFLVVRAGMTLIISQADDKLSSAKRTIASTLIGIMLARISQELVKAFYFEGIKNGGTAGATTLQLTVYGIINWVLVVTAALGALMIVISVLRAISSFGKEEGTTNIRQTILGVASGVLMIALLPAVKLTLGISDLQPFGETAVKPKPDTIIGAVSDIVGNLLMFLALLAVAVVIYAGVRVIVNPGNEDELKKSQSLIIRAMIGLFVILISYAAVVFLIGLGGNVAP